LALVILTVRVSDNLPSIYEKLSPNPKTPSSRAKAAHFAAEIEDPVLSEAEGTPYFVLAVAVAVAVALAVAVGVAVAVAVSFAVAVASGVGPDFSPGI
jgi:hypothetical protein